MSANHIVSEGRINLRWFAYNIATVRFSSIFLLHRSSNIAFIYRSYMILDIVTRTFPKCIVINRATQTWPF